MSLRSQSPALSSSPTRNMYRITPSWAMIDRYGATSGGISGEVVNPNQSRLIQPTATAPVQSRPTPRRSPAAGRLARASPASTPAGKNHGRQRQQQPGKRIGGFDWLMRARRPCIDVDAWTPSGAARRSPTARMPKKTAHAADREQRVKDGESPPRTLASGLVGLGKHARSPPRSITFEDADSAARPEFAARPQPPTKAGAHKLRSLPERIGVAITPLRRFRLANFVPDLLHRGPDLIDFVLEQVADQEIGHKTLEMRKSLDEAAEAEAVVVGTDEPPHPLHALDETGLPLAELGARCVPLGKSFADRIGGHLART